MGWAMRHGPRQCWVLAFECRRFSKICHFIFRALVALKLLVSLMSFLVACSARILEDTHTHRLVSLARPSHKERGSGQTGIVELWQSIFHCPNVRRTFKLVLGKQPYYVPHSPTFSTHLALVSNWRLRQPDIIQAIAVPQLYYSTLT